MKRWWVKVLVAIAVVIAICGVSFFGSTIRSKSELDRAMEELRASGEILDWQKIVPPKLSTEENAVEFFSRAEPYLKDSFNDVLSTNPPGSMQMVAPGRAISISQQPKIFAYDCQISWDELNQALAKRAPLWDFFSEINRRKSLQFDLDYLEGPTLRLTHLSSMKRWSQLSTAVILADLHAGEARAAATNQHYALSLLALWDHEPILISQLVRLAMYQISCSSQWEILQHGNLSEADLSMMQSDWERIDLRQRMETALVGERIFEIETVQRFRTSNSPPDFGWVGGPGGSFGWSSSPSDWWDDLKDNGRTFRQRIGYQMWRTSWSLEDEKMILKTDQVLIEALREVRTNGFYKDALEKARKKNNLTIETYRKNYGIRAILKDEMDEFILSPDALVKALDKLLITEAARQLAITAIALKRFELKYGHLPDRLEPLVPEFVKSLPRDPVDGKPLRYRLNSDDTFLLYSIGANAFDDAGSAAFTNSASKSFSWQKGLDWVWPQIATEAEIRAWEASQSSP